MPGGPAVRPVDDECHCLTSSTKTNKLLIESMNGPAVLLARTTGYIRYLPSLQIQFIYTLCTAKPALTLRILVSLLGF